MQVEKTAEGMFSSTFDESEVNTISAIAVYHGITEAEALTKMLTRSFNRYTPRTMNQIEGTPEKDKV